MSIQLFIVLIYLVITLIIGIYAKNKSTTSSSFHGAGLGILMCVAAGTGEWLGGTSTTGISEYGFLFGLSGAWYTISNGIGIIVLALLFAKLYRSLNTVTVPGIIEKYIGKNARIVSSILLTFVMIAVGTAQIIAAGTLGVIMLKLDYTTSVLIFGIGIIIYTLAGGMIAVGYTNTLHLSMMYGGVILALIFVISDIGGIASLKSSLAPNPYFTMGGIGIPKVFSWIIASILGACTAQAGIQPILAAKDVNTAKKAALITAFVVIPFGLFTALLGMAAKVKHPDLTNAKLALPTLMMDLHPLIGGIILASILAAILSTVSPIILASGTMLTKDIYHRIFKPDASDRHILRISRATTGISGLLCILLAIFIYDSTKILDIVYFAYTLRGSLFVILLFGIYCKTTSQKASIYAMILTALVGLFWVTYKASFDYYPIHPMFTETYASVLTAFVSMIILNRVFGEKKGLYIQN